MGRKTVTSLHALVSEVPTSLSCSTGLPTTEVSLEGLLPCDPTPASSTLSLGNPAASLHQIHVPVPSTMVRMGLCFASHTVCLLKLPEDGSLLSNLSTTTVSAHAAVRAAWRPYLLKTCYVEIRRLDRPPSEVEDFITGCRLSQRGAGQGRGDSEKPTKKTGSVEVPGLRVEAKVDCTAEGLGCTLPQGHAGNTSTLISPTSYLHSLEPESLGGTPSSLLINHMA